MSPWSRSPLVRPAALVIAASLALLLILSRRATTPTDDQLLPSWARTTTGKPAGKIIDKIIDKTMPGSQDPLARLSVTVVQTSTSPPTLRVKVTNDNPVPATILIWDSPLDPAALALGVVKISRVSPDGHESPLDLPTIVFRRKTPPDPDQLVTIEAGGSTERDVPLKEPTVSTEQLFGAGGGDSRSTIKVKGQWASVWLSRRDDISSDSLEKMGFADDAFTGDFESDVVELRQ